MTGRRDPHASESAELLKEGLTMALYVSVCLLAASAVVAESPERNHVEALGLVWGTTLGLALAHLFAFRVSARLISSGTVDEHDVRISVAQLLGAIAVAALCTGPVVLMPATSELDAVRLLLAGLVALVAFLTARRGGKSLTISLAYGMVVLVVALAVAVVKNLLSGH